MIESITRRIRTRTTLFASFLVVLGIGTILSMQGSGDEPVASVSVAPGTHPPVGFEEELYYRGLASIDPDEQSNEHIKGVVVPHHYIASSMMAEVFALVGQQNPKRILLIGPNHFFKGEHDVISSRYAWQTVHGPVAPDFDAINQLVEEGAVHVDEVAISTEHSVGGLMPFVRHYVPDAHVIPIMLDYHMRLDEITELAETLSPIARSSDTVAIASVDFSHYLTVSEAEEKDTITLQLMQDREYETIRSLSDAHLDSPASLITLFKLMDDLALNEFKIIDHQNSGILLRDEYSETTSYYTLTFSEK